MGLLNIPPKPHGFNSHALAAALHVTFKASTDGDAGCEYGCRWGILSGGGMTHGYSGKAMHHATAHLLLF